MIRRKTTIPLQKYVRAIAVVSDTHIGSVSALFPEEFRTEEGNVRKANPAQLALLEYWNYFIKKCDEYKVDTVLHLGDALDGTQPRQRKSSGLILNDLTEQRDAFIALMRPLVKDRIFVMCSGTEYHESIDFEVHKDLVEQLRPVTKRAIFIGAMGTLEIKETGQVINIAHGTGATFIYRGQLLDRESMFTKLAEVYGKIDSVDVILRGHLHFFHSNGQSSPLVMQIPCWELYTPNKLTLSVWGRKQPDIGGVIMLFTETGEIDIRKFVMEKNPQLSFLRKVRI